jgi:glycine/serine hydroxymethyltransferase
MLFFHACLKPGDKILGFDLSHGHLTHGSPVNFFYAFKTHVCRARLRAKQAALLFAAGKRLEYKVRRWRFAARNGSYALRRTTHSLCLEVCYDGKDSAMVIREKNGRVIS